MQWSSEVQFVAAVPLPEDRAAQFGTTVNGMWASPERFNASEVADRRKRGQRVLFSVPMIALTPTVYEAPETEHLLNELCVDVDGNTAIVPWYYWEAKPVYSTCIFSEQFREYLLARCRDGVDRGMDVVNLDEINTSVGLISRRAGGSGFCPSCLRQFRASLEIASDVTDSERSSGRLDDAALRARLKEDDLLYALYRRVLETAAFHTVAAFIETLRSYADERGHDFAVTANLAYLGNNVATHGPLWGPMWGRYLDFVIMENAYQLVPQIESEHLLLPRGKFTAWYRLGGALSNGVRTWICPSIRVPKQFSGQARQQYYLLMFVEALANRGSWAYYWWPGVDIETRIAATVPEQLGDYAAFVARYRRYYEAPTRRSEMAILYLDSAIGRNPESHFKYIALAQALAESGYQFDVIYGGDGIYASDVLEPLDGYATVLVPQADNLTPAQKSALERYADLPGHRLVIFSDTNVGTASVAPQTGKTLLDFWYHYRFTDRAEIAAVVEASNQFRVRASLPTINAIPYHTETERIVHLINYDYDADTDTVSPAHNLVIRLPWAEGDIRECLLLSPDKEVSLNATMADGNLTVEVGDLAMYGLLVVR